MRRTDVPQNIDLEIPLLGMLMLSDKAIECCSGILHDDAFYHPQHSVIYKAIATLYRSLQPTDATSVAAKLADLGQLASVGGKAALLKICDMTPHGVDVEAYAKEVQRYYLLRQLVEVGQKISRMAYDTEKPLKEIIQASEQELFAVTQQHWDGKGFASPSDLAGDLMLEIERRSRLSTPPGIPTGFYDFDAITQGLKPGRAYYLIGRPGSGKTSFGLQAAHYMASKYNLTVAYFSLEMPKDELVMRLMSAESEIPSGRLESGRVKDEEWPALAEAVTRLVAADGLKIDDAAGLSIEDIASRCRKLQSDTGNLAAVFIDHIQLLNYGRMKEYEALSHITKQIKAIAKELNVPVLPLCQLNRGVEERQDKRPQMSDIRGSGTAEQDADVIVGFYRDDYYNPESVDRGTCEAIFLKHRGGPTGTIKLLFEPWLTRFRNLSSRSGGDVVVPMQRPQPKKFDPQARDSALRDRFGG